MLNAGRTLRKQSICWEGSHHGLPAPAQSSPSEPVLLRNTCQPRHAEVPAPQGPAPQGGEDAGGTQRNPGDHYSVSPHFCLCSCQQLVPPVACRLQVLFLWPPGSTAGSCLRPQGRPTWLVMRLTCVGCRLPKSELLGPTSSPMMEVSLLAHAQPSLHLLGPHYQALLLVALAPAL